MSSNLIRESWKVLGPRVRLPFANLSGTGAFSSMGMKPRETKTQLPSEFGVINLETVCFLSTWSKRVEHNQTSPSLDQSDANSNLSFLTDTAKCADLVSKIIDRWWYRTQDLPITSQPCQPPRTFNSVFFLTGSILKKVRRVSNENGERTSRLRFSDVNEYNCIDGDAESLAKRVKVRPIYSEPAFSSDDEFWNCLRKHFVSFELRTK